MNRTDWLPLATLAGALRRCRCVGSKFNIDRSQNKSAGRCVCIASWAVPFVLVGLLWVTGLRAQTPEEHASHHPGQAAGSAPAAGAMPAGAPAPAGGMPAGEKPAGGGMGDMGEMMKGMGGAPPQKELYPSLMALPELSPEQRKQVEQQANERMHAGTALIAQALDALNTGTQSGDYAAMQEAMTRLREGAAQLESGIAARRALAEGRAPRAVALDWFKREMNLASPIQPEHPRAHLGVTPFHLFTMGLLIVFALAMVAMYFFKMRRAAALFGRIDPDSGKPPPGSAPPLAAPPAADAKAAPPAAEAKSAPPAAPPVADVKPAPPAADAKAPSSATDAKDASPAASSAAGAKAAPPAAPAADAKAAAPKQPAATKFTCVAPSAREVFLVGTFNDWNQKATPMIKDAAGNWDVAVPLPPGRYEFKFVVDGALCCEPGCEGPHSGCPKCVPNKSGTMNRVLEVS